eukprot:1146510-Pelagomonas_calceolata.AAC.6
MAFTASTPHACFLTLAAKPNPEPCGLAGCRPCAHGRCGHPSVRISVGWGFESLGPPTFSLKGSIPDTFVARDCCRLDGGECHEVCS